MRRVQQSQRATPPRLRLGCGGAGEPFLREDGDSKASTSLCGAPRPLAGGVDSSAYGNSEPLQVRSEEASLCDPGHTLHSAAVQKGQGTTAEPWKQQILLLL